MEKGTLTPRSLDVVEQMRFSGGFAQPDGFASVLTVQIRKSGEVCLALTYKTNGRESMWGVELTNEQRNTLGAMLCRYQPTLYECIKIE